MVSAAVTSHAMISSPGDCTCRATSADTIKMPEPIIEPITSVVADTRPRPLTKPAGSICLVLEAILRYAP